jgi:hypothetical protein
VVERSYPLLPYWSSAGALALGHLKASYTESVLSQGLRQDRTVGETAKVAAAAVAVAAAKSLVAALAAAAAATTAARRPEAPASAGRQW